MLETHKTYMQELNHVGAKLKSVAKAAQSYHIVLNENRKLYNELQDLKGNNGGSTDKVAHSIIAVQDPFGSQSVTSHPSTGHPICSPFIRTGISSMPVIDKPATTRISSLVTSRHISQRPLTVRARKYHPRNDEPKVAFFDHTNEIQVTQKMSTLIPRENPRSMFGAASKLSEVSSAKDEAK